MKTTLEAIRKHSPCKEGWEKLLKHLGKTTADSAPLDLLTILESNGPDDTLWCLRAVEGHEEAIRRLACDFALSVAHLWEMPAAVRGYLEHPTEGTREAAADAAADAAAWAAATEAAAWAAWVAAKVAAGAAAGAAERAAAGAEWAAEKGKQLVRLKKLLEETR